MSWCHFSLQDGSFYTPIRREVWLRQGTSNCVWASLFGLCTSAVFRLDTAIFLERNHLEMQTHIRFSPALCSSPAVPHLPAPKACLYFPHKYTFQLTKPRLFYNIHDLQICLSLNNITLTTITKGTVLLFQSLLWREIYFNFIFLGWGENEFTWYVGH
jgi:hypothetical protein